MKASDLIDIETNNSCRIAMYRDSATTLYALRRV